MSAIDILVAKLPQWESNVPFMYLDSRGNVTVGVGNMIPNMAAAVALPFYVPNGPNSMRPANALEIQNDWKRLQGMSFGNYRADYYDSSNPPSPTLRNDARMALLTTYVTQEEVTLSQRLSCYAGLPECVQVSALDMAYNLGVQGFLSKFPACVRALEAQEYQLASTLCQRVGIGAARNAWTAQMILSAE